MGVAKNRRKRPRRRDTGVGRGRDGQTFLGGVVQRKADTEKTKLGRGNKEFREMELTAAILSLVISSGGANVSKARSGGCWRLIRYGVHSRECCRSWRTRRGQEKQQEVGAQMVPARECNPQVVRS